jgi:hypothetical protein
MSKVQIKHRFMGVVLFSGNFDTMRLCVEAARRSGADLRGADLHGAYLRGADLRGAYLVGADLRGAKWRDGVTLNRAPIKMATRTDGHEFLLLDTDAGWRVQAGCRFFSMDEAWRHWKMTRAETALGDETFDILVLFEHQIERDARK